MLPEKRKNLIILIVSIIGVILVIIIMYNFSKFMQNQGNVPEEIVYDDPYPSDYKYYGFIIDEDGNYQLMGLSSDFTEELLGLRSFYPMSDIYFYNDHLVLYTDAINQINYNFIDDEYLFYELNPFYSNDTEVLITPDYYIFYTSTTLSYCNINDCQETLVTNSLTDDLILTSENVVFYELADGIHKLDMTNGEDKIIAYSDSSNNLSILLSNDKYLVYMNGSSIYSYTVASSSTTNISDTIIAEEGEFSIINLQDDYLLYQIVDEDGNNCLKKYSFRIHAILKNTYNLGNEEITYSKVIDENLIYAQLVNEDNVRYVIMDTTEQKVVKEFENSYVTLIGVE